MGEKTAGVGHFAIPTAPAAGVSVVSGAANVFTTTYVQMIASTAAALFITGIYVQRGSAAPTYCAVQIATGAAASETIVGQHLIDLPPTIAGALRYKPIFPPIPVANATRIAVKTADSVGAATTLITLECVAQANVVDDGVAVGSVSGAVGSVIGAVGSVTGAVGSVTAAVVLPSIPANWITAAGITAAAFNGKGDWNIGKTGYTLTQTFPTNFSTLSISAITGLVDITQTAADKAWLTAARVLTAGTNIPLAPTVVQIRAEMDSNSTKLANLDAAISSRLATAGYTVPDNTSIAAVKVQTDKLTFTVVNKLDANVLVVNGVTVTGTGTVADPWKGT